MEKTCICIMGMHRSGTSALAGSLVRMGFDCGYSLIPKGPENKKGFYENQEVLRINEELLGSIGKSWPDINTTPLFDLNNDSFTNEVATLIRDEFSRPEKILIKDPRFSHTFPQWHEALKSLGYNVLILIAIRNPFEVASSLYKRNVISFDQSYLLYARYVLNAISVSRSANRIILDYKNLLKKKSKLLKEVLGNLNPQIKFTQSELNNVEDYLVGDLHHHKNSEEPVDEDKYSLFVSELYFFVQNIGLKSNEEVDEVTQEFHERLSRLCQEYISEASKDESIDELRLSYELHIDELETINEDLTNKNKSLLEVIDEFSLRIAKEKEQYEKTEKLLRQKNTIADELRETVKKSREELLNANGQVEIWKSKSPFISIIIICWNNRRFLKDCFDSILSQTYENYEIILVDNDSSDDSVELTQINYPSVRIIELENNIGFAQGNNVAIEKVLDEKKSEFIFILNPDTKLESDCLSELVDKAKEYYTFGSFSPKLLMLECPEYLNSAGGDCLFKCGDNLARSFFVPDTENPESDINTVRDIFGPSGAATFIRTDLLRLIGGFEPQLFTYYEDVELNMKVLLSGWRSLYVPSSRVHHYQGGTLDDFSEWKMFLLNRNKFIVLLRCLPIQLWRRYFKDIMLSYLALMKHLKSIGKLKIGARITITLLGKLPYHLLQRRRLYQKLKPSHETGEYIGSLIEDHENAMTPDVRHSSFKAYNEYMSKRLS